MIRCAVDAREYSQPNRLTGIGRFLTNIIGPLGQHPEEFEFVLMTGAPDSVPARLQRLPGIRVEALPKYSLPVINEVVLPHRAKTLKSHCFFSPFYRGPLFPGMPMVVTVHDLMFLRLPALPPLIRSLTKLHLRSIVRRASKIITVSKFTERDLIDLVPAATDKTVVMYSDIGMEWFRLLTDRSRASTPAVPPETFGRYFLYVGTFKPHKNVDLLVKGFHAALNTGRIPEHRLVLVGGDDDNSGRILRLIKRLELEKRVFICRDIDDFSLSRLYQEADWFVTASQYEGFGYPPVEAMIAQCPVICHQTTSLIEVVGSAGLPITALTVPEVCNALLRATRIGAAERQEFVEAGRRQCRLFKPGQTAEAFARLIRSLVISPDAFPMTDTIGRKTQSYMGENI